MRKCENCKRNVRKVYAEYLSFDKNTSSWPDIQKFIIENLLNNILFVKSSINNVKQLLCFKLMPITANASGYIYILCAELMTSSEIEILQTEILKNFCHEYFQCDTPQTIPVDKTVEELSEPNLSSSSHIEDRKDSDTIINGLHDLVGKLGR